MGKLMTISENTSECYDVQFSLALLLDGGS